MRRFLTCALATGVLCGVFWMAPIEKAILAADNGHPIAQADHTLIQAFANGDKAAAGALLDEQFSWVNDDGSRRTKAEALENLPELAAASQGDTDIEFHDYGQLTTILGNHHNAMFARVWVKRPGGWQLFAYIDTPITTGARGGAGRGRGRAGAVGGAARNTDCDNPCRTLPYTPATKMDKEIADAWMKTKVAEWKPNYEIWEPLTADEFYLRTSGGSVNKTTRAEQIKRGQAAGTVSPPAPVSSITIDDFGDNSAVMWAASVPRGNAKPSYALRVWVFRDNRWQLALSQTTPYKVPESSGASGR